MDFLRPARAAVRAPSARLEPPVSASVDGVASESQWNMAIGGTKSRAGVRVDEKATLSLPATMQALRILAGVFAMTPRHFYARKADGRDHLSDHPLQRLIHDAPNSFQTAFEFFELSMQDMMLTGNFFAYVSRDMAGQPVALTRLRSLVKVAEYFDRREGYTLFYDATLPDGTNGRFPAREILHVRGFSRDGLQGVSPMTYMRDAIGGAIATADHAARYFGEGAKPEIVLTSKQKISPEARRAIKSDWTSTYAGPTGDKVAVLDQELTPEFLSHDNQESQFVETREFQVVELARIWGVPPHLIFDLSKATFSNIEQQSLEFVIYHLGPHYERFAQALTRAFAPDGHYFEHLTDALVKGDLKTRMEAYWLQRQMGMVSANELRQRDNQNPIPGAAGSEYWRPANMALAGTPPAAPAMPPIGRQPEPAAQSEE